MTGMVKFSNALTELVLDEEDHQRIDVLVEIGPHPALKGPSNQTLDQLKIKVPYSMQKLCQPARCSSAELPKH
ncbi:hypothetical protein BDW74DRAFT_142018 [Aspergillus multicolor]|uniref:uncharacterized protein n=1 Tax=Aspergillus multicolor TaxID=41759 RepID=UPI003CCD1734